MKNKVEINAFEKAIGYLSRGIKTERAIWDYLKKKEYPKGEIFEAVQKLKEYGYINDGEYARCFVNTYSRTKGKSYIRAQLFQKGVNGETINSALESLEDQGEAIKALAEKYMRGKVADAKTKQKLIAHLLSKGFGYDEVREQIIRTCPLGRTLAGIENRE